MEKGFLIVILAPQACNGQNLKCFELLKPFLRSTWEYWQEFLGVRTMMGNINTLASGRL